MHFLATLVLSGLALLLQTAQAFPAGDNWVVLSTEETANGTLSFYSPPSSPPALAERHLARLVPCGKVEIICSDTKKHQADLDVCDSLINALIRQSEWGVSAAPQSICLRQQRHRCCVSWATPVFRNFRQGHLVLYAQQAFDKCKNTKVAGKVSAIARNVTINGVCTTQCLSNKPDGCS